MKNATFDISKKILGPAHLLTQINKWDYLRSLIIEKKIRFLFLTLEKFLEAMGSRIGTGTFFSIHFHFRTMCTGPMNERQNVKCELLFEVRSRFEF